MNRNVNYYAYAYNNSNSLAAFTNRKYKNSLSGLSFYCLTGDQRVNSININYVCFVQLFELRLTYLRTLYNHLTHTQYQIQCKYFVSNLYHVFVFVFSRKDYNYNYQNTKPKQKKQGSPVALNHSVFQSFFVSLQKKITSYFYWIIFFHTILENK